MSAEACEAPAARWSVTRELASVLMAARPSAPPIWKAALTMPDAAPASWAWMSATASTWFGTPTNEMPAPNSAKPGRMWMA